MTEQNFTREKNEYTLLLTSFVANIIIIIVYLILDKKDTPCFLQYIILILFSTTLALFLFGAIQRLESSGQFSGKIFGINITFGGPAALAIFLIWGGTRQGFITCLEPGPVEKPVFSYVIVLKDSLGEGIRISNSRLKMWLEGEPLPGLADALNSRFKFDPIPSKFTGKKVNVEFNESDYFFSNNRHETNLNLYGTDTILVVYKRNQIEQGDTGILHIIDSPAIKKPNNTTLASHQMKPLKATGTVKDISGRPIPGAKVSALSEKSSAVSNSQGYFELIVYTTSDNLEFIRISIEKQGFQSFSDWYNFPSDNHEAFLK